MKTYLKPLAATLLLVNGLGALYGGWNLTAHPDGSSLKMPLSILEFSPFRDFLIPGIILFVTNGIFSLYVLWRLILHDKRYPWLVAGQGAILFGWIVIQVMMVLGIAPLHIIFGGIGLVLILCGLLLERVEVFAPGLQGRPMRPVHVPVRHRPFAAR